MQRKRAKPPSRIAVRACLVAAVALVGAVLWAGSRESLLAWYWEHALAGASGEADGGSSVAPQANEILKRLLTLGRPGLVAVMRAVGHPRDDISRAAYLVLDRAIDRWESGPHAETRLLAADLAKALAERIDGWCPPAKARAARLAMRLIHRSPSATDLDVRELLAACNRILHASDGVESTSLGTGNDIELTSAVPVISGDKATNPQPSTAEAPSTPPAHHSMILGLADMAPPDLPRVSNAGTGNAPLLGFTKAAPRTESQSQRTGEVQQANYDDRSDNEQTNAERAVDASQRLRDLDAPALLAKLHEPDDAIAARAELDARGFSPRQIDVGKHLLSPDASERLRWIEAVPGIRGIDARYWLLRLSHDKNVHVRRTAISLLATDRNPEVIRRLQQAAIDDVDPDLRDQASRALEVLQSD